MLSRTKIITAVSVLVIAAIAGVIAGRYFTSTIFGSAKAESPDPLLSDVDPEWTDLNVAYLVSNSGVASSDIFAPTTLADKINAQIVTNSNDLMQLSQSQRLDVVLIDRPMLATVDRKWAFDQYRHGTAFVGLNITPQELGDVIDDPDFAHGEGWDDVSYPEPFLSQTMWRAGGDAEQIRQLAELNALYPLSEENSNTWERLNITNVTTIATKGYGDVTAENLVNQLDNIRINLNNAGPVNTP